MAIHWPAMPRGSPPPLTVALIGREVALGNWSKIISFRHREDGAEYHRPEGHQKTTTQALTTNWCA